MTALAQGSGQERILLAFDFDHTLIDDNVDLSVCKLSPSGELPPEVRALYKDDGWIEYMGAVFKHLHGFGVTAQDYQNHVKNLPLAPGMHDLFEHVQKVSSYDSIIISDANTVFIDYLLKHHKLDTLFNQVFTNPAEYDSSGCLLINNFHTQDWCPLSTVNLCKGHILQNYIQAQQNKGVTYSCIVYIGDGSNDLCPGLTLREQDYLLPRKGFSLWKKLQKMTTAAGKEGNSTKIAASVVGWDSAAEIRRLLETLSANTPSN
jgi:pyridoxal phosphate phosphatase PHOSPHO2